MVKIDNADNCKFEGYKSVHLLRPVDNHIDFKNIGGGISIYIRNNISFKQRKDLNVILPFIECSFIEVNLNNKKYLIAGIYRIPNTNINTFL